MQESGEYRVTRHKGRGPDSEDAKAIFSHRTYGLTTTPLPERFRQSGVFGGRVCCGLDVRFCARLCPECRLRRPDQCVDAINQGEAVCRRLVISR
jgi:hypothetical protein